jgi:hypothetical protein
MLLILGVLNIPRFLGSSAGDIFSMCNRHISMDLHFIVGRFSRSVDIKLRDG